VNYKSSGIGDLSVVLLLAVTLLLRPSGLFGKWTVAGH
jgi:branched-subunit amino acid ABC-type transport system permease component